MSDSENNLHHSISITENKEILTDQEQTTEETESESEEYETEFYISNSNDEETYIPIALPGWMQFLMEESNEMTTESNSE